MNVDGVTYRTQVGAALFDWTRTKTGNYAAGWREVVSILRPEDLGRLTDGRGWRGSTAERCALHGGSTRPHNLGVRD